MVGVLLAGTLNGRLLDSPSAFSHFFFSRTGRNQFVKKSLFKLGAQDASQALNILALCAITTDNDSNAAIRHIDTFVQHSPRHQLAVLAGTETLQDDAPLLGRRLVGVM